MFNFGDFWRRVKVKSVKIGPVILDIIPDEKLASPDLKQPLESSIESPSNDDNFIVIQYKELEKLCRYARLEAYLDRQLWCEADNETLELIKFIMTVNGMESFKSEDYSKFPCEELKLINTLWVDNSNDTFGFSIQRAIYKKCRDEFRNESDQEIWKKFAAIVGWREENGNWRKYNKLKSSDNFPRGSFPDFSLCQHEDSWVASFISRTDY